MAGLPTLNDRKLAANVRSKILKHIEEVLDGDDKVFRKALILKMATNILPRIHEVTGEDGQAINIAISKEASDKLEFPVGSLNAISGVVDDLVDETV